ncbi:MAG TPA: NAD(P)H-binding protein [Pseudolysinimonas sp.]|nr:NAD(P)H-binding protein [Pseudolysinimonas sp.]
MAQITVLGGTGYSGEAIVREANARGHQVTSWSRGPASSPIAGVRYETGSLLDPDVRVRAVDGADAVVGALSPRGELEADFASVYGDIARLAAAASSTWAVVGGYSSRRTVPGGPRIAESFEVPEEWRPEIDAMVDVIDALERTAPAGLDWFYLSPPLEFGGDDPVEGSGTYHLVADGEAPVHASPRLSAADLARAIVDEIESPQHRGGLFGISAG